MNKLAHIFDEDLCEGFELEEPATFIATEDEKEGRTVLKFNNLREIASLLGVISDDLHTHGKWISGKHELRKIDVDCLTNLVTIYEAPEVDEEDEEEEESEGRILHVGDTIAYRVNFYTITDLEEDGVWAVGPYGEGQWIDREDILTYNPEVEGW